MAATVCDKLHRDLPWKMMCSFIVLRIAPIKECFYFFSTNFCYFFYIQLHSVEFSEFCFLWWYSGRITHLVLQKQNDLKPWRNFMHVYEDFSLLNFFMLQVCHQKKKKYNLQDFNACKVLTLNLIAKCWEYVMFTVSILHLMEVKYLCAFKKIS